MRSSLIVAVLALAGIAAAIQAQNPYTLGKKVFVSPHFLEEIDAAGRANPAMKAKFDALDKLPGYMAAAQAQDALIQLVVYDLPNRDCAALASNGELLVNDDGLNKYKTQYIDRLNGILNQYPTVPVVMVIEPDSLPNMVTNKEKTTSCKEVNSVQPSIYHQGVAYAIRTLKGANRYMYIDAAHECWLGWENNMAGFLQVINDVMNQAGDTSSVRGFAVNVANYQSMTNTIGCKESNPIYGLLQYVQKVHEKFQWGVFGQGPHFIVDTSRNGVQVQRADVGNWCNIKGAGLGERPKANPNPSYPMIDAYTWIKTPGESDGTSDSSATRYDAKCGSVDSMTGAPQAGKWFQTQFEMLVTNANPAVDGTPSAASSSKTPAHSSSKAPASQNPYSLGKKVFVNPDYASEIDAASRVNPSMKAKFNVVKKYPTFIWLDTISMARHSSPLSGSLPDPVSKAQDALIQLVVYDLPNRDCAALASNGELLIKDNGLFKYKYIDRLNKILNQYPTVPVVMVIEPDSLPNMVTNLQTSSSCREVNSVQPSIYHQGVAYAISTLKGANRYMYIDAAHECWLGWENNMAGFLQVINDVMNQAGDTSSVRGFSVNVANYQTLQNAKGCGDFNPVYGLLDYVQKVFNKFQNGVFGQGPHFIVDTSRNGADTHRAVVGDWCNIKGAGLGERPKANPNPSYPMIDAYTWIKPPGESDGTSDSSAPRYDGKCGSVDSMTGAPQAGKWFQTQFEMLVNNANPAINPDMPQSSSGTSPATHSSSRTPAGHSSSTRPAHSSKVAPNSDDSFHPGSASSLAAHDPNDVGLPRGVIRRLHRVVGARLHCWIGFGLIVAQFLYNVVEAWIRSHVLHHTVVNDYAGLSGFFPKYMQWAHGPISDGWNRPIRGGPGKYIEVIPRKRYVMDRVRVALVPDMEAPTRRCLNLGSYNYLGYGGVFPGITEGILEAVDRSGVSLCKEDAAVLSMGFATNSLVIPALVGRGGLVISDELNHASAITGIRTSTAAVRVFRHNDMQHLEQLLRAATSATERGRWSRILIVVEGLYSMMGDLCPLREIVALKERYGALLYIDEAHSIGALGPTGRGVCEYCGVSPRRVDVLMGTFTKSFGSIGGYIAADRDTVAYVRRTAPGFLYGAAMSPPCAQQIVLALQHMQTGAGLERIRRLRDNSVRLRRLLIGEHCELLGAPDSPVVALMIRHPAKLAVFSRMLLKKGVATVLVGYPATPITGLASRLCVCAAFDPTEVEEAVSKIASVARELSIDFLTESQARRALAGMDAYLSGLRQSEMPDMPSVDPSQRPYTSQPIAPRGYADSCRPERVAEKLEMNLSAQDYLGLANCSEVREAAKRTIATYGCGSCSARGFYGTTDKHLELEQRISEFVGYEATILYSYGALVATSVIPPYANEANDVIFYDEGVSMSSQIGVQLARAKGFAYAHNDMGALERLMATVSKCKEFAKGRKYIATEGVFANSGDVAPLPELVALKRRYGASLVVDETHSLGVLGSTGRGLREHWAERTGDAALMEQTTIEFLVGSLETAFGSIGGFCCGSRRFMAYQVLSGLGYVFSASAPPYLCSAAVAAIDKLDREAADITPALRRNVERARAAAAERLGALYEVSGDASSPVMMVSLRKRGATWAAREEDEAVLESVSAKCREEGLGVCVARFVAADTAATARPALRVCVSARYEPAEYDAAFEKIAVHTAAALQAVAAH
eukprot:m51a1_g3947 putative serine palmitoyltransferase (1711) ;mRNA; r:304145-311487